jgi:hypothetical protein
MSRRGHPFSVRTTLLALATLVLLSACSAEILFSPGGVSGDWLANVEEVEVIPVTVVVVPPDLHSSLTLTWSNDGLASGAVEPTEALALIWAASGGKDRFVQVARSDMAVVAPTLAFPEFVPESVAYVSSQLVFTTRTGELAHAPVAAFGLWSVEPYSLSRSVAQKAVVFVHELGEEPTFEGDLTLGCSQFQDRELSSCDPVQIGDGSGWWLSSLEGNILVWYIGTLRYEMTVRPPITRAIGEKVAASSVPLGTLLGTDVDVTSDSQG